MACILSDKIMLKSTKSPTAKIAIYYYKSAIFLDVIYGWPLKLKVIVCLKEKLTLLNDSFNTILPLRLLKI